MQQKKPADYAPCQSDYSNLMIITNTTSFLQHIKTSRLKSLVLLGTQIMRLTREKDEKFDYMIISTSLNVNTQMGEGVQTALLVDNLVLYDAFIRSRQVAQSRVVWF